MHHITIAFLVLAAIALCTGCVALLLARRALADAREAFDRAAIIRNEAERLAALQNRVTRGVELIARAYDLPLEKNRNADCGRDSCDQRRCNSHLH